MDLLAYFRVLRRRWALIFAFVVVGGTIGAASTLLGGEAAGSSSRYKATNTLVFQGFGGSSSTGSSSSSSTSSSSAQPAFTNLDQIAVLVTTGDVPSKVADTLGMEPHEVTERITTESDSTANTLAIIGIDTDAKTAEQLSDTVGQQVIDTLNEKEQARFDRLTRDTIARLDRLRSDIAALDAQIGPGGSEIARAERDGLVDQYRLAFERFQQLAADGAPTGGLSTLETASAIPISTSTYDTLLERGQLGENHKRADVQQQTDEESTDTAPSTPSFDSPVSRGLLGAFLGLLVGIGVALVAERFDRRLRTRDDVAAAFALPVLAEVPRLTSGQLRQKEVVVHTAPISRAAEAYRAVRSSLLFQNAHLDGSGDGSGGGNGAGAARTASSGKEALVVMVASAVPGDGKTSTSVNLAAAFAETGSSVLVVNCDFRRPMAHTYLRAADTPRRTLRTAVPGVWFVSRAVSDPDANPAQVIAAQQAVISTARDHFDVIVLDTAPLLTANDAVEVVGSADLVLLVSRFQSTTTDNAQRAMELLNRVHAPVAGVVVIGTPEDAGAYYYYQYRGRRPHEQASATAENEGAGANTVLYDADVLDGDDLFAGSPREPGSPG
jgi:Mrp family chromosome partitioning ATPase/capsular polysaccharide biosynthesis protein